LKDHQQKNKRTTNRQNKKKSNLQSDQSWDHQQKRNPPIFEQDHENPDHKTRNKMRNQKGSNRIP
jgi:hypothetical protein